MAGGQRAEVSGRWSVVGGGARWVRRGGPAAEGGEQREKETEQICLTPFLVLRDKDIDNNGSLDQRVYFTQDANDNVTAVINNTSSSVLQRQIIDPYGNVTFKTSGFGATSDSYAVEHLNQGMWHDSVLSLDQSETRWYSPSLMRWISADPSSNPYVDGMNWFIDEGDNTVNAVDPTGLRRIVFAFEGLGGFNAGEKQRVLGDPTGTTAPAHGAGNASDSFLLELVRAARLTTDPDTTVNYYAQNSVESAVADAFKAAKEEIYSSKRDYAAGDMCHNTIIALGFSQGGDAAIQFAGALRGKGTRIDLGFTVDPVPKGAGLVTRNFVDFSKPSNALSWINYYQTFGGSLGIVGHPVNGADNGANQNITAQVKTFMQQGPFAHDLSKPLPPLYGGHLFITQLPTVIDALNKNVLAVNDSRRD